MFLTYAYLESFMHFFDFKFSVVLADVVISMKACMKLLLLRHYNSQGNPL